VAYERRLPDVVSSNALRRSSAGAGAATTSQLDSCLSWAVWGSVDIVATAPGKIIPTGRTKVIQPFETGVVRAIHVRDGQSVTAGEVLIELNPTMNAAELEHTKSDLLAAQLDVAHYRAALAGNEDPLADFEPPPGASPKCRCRVAVLMAAIE
jgi:hemolysin D